MGGSFFHFSCDFNVILTKISELLYLILEQFIYNKCLGNKVNPPPFLHREGAADTNKKRKKKEKQLLLLKLGLYNQIKDEA